MEILLICNLQIFMFYVILYLKNVWSRAADRNLCHAYTLLLKNLRIEVLHTITVWHNLTHAIFDGTQTYITLSQRIPEFLEEFFFSRSEFQNFQNEAS
jgi:hypothetical protein